MSFIAGAYTMTWDAVTAGQLQGGVTLSHQFFKQPIQGDVGAQTVQDSVFQGGDVSMASTLMEYNATNARKVFWPYGSAYLTMSEIIGKLDVQDSLVKQVVLTAITGTPAQTLGAPATITLPRAILQAGVSVDILLAPEHRVIPFRTRIYPDVQFVFGTLT